MPEELTLKMPLGITPENEDILNKFKHQVHDIHLDIAAHTKTSNVIVDDLAFYDQPLWELEHFSRSLEDARIVLVGVKCSLEEAERREQARKNRTSGLVKIQFDQIHKPGIYDIVVDTSADSLEDCAVKIQRYLQDHLVSIALKKLLEWMVRFRSFGI